MTEIFLLILTLAFIVSPKLNLMILLLFSFFIFLGKKINIVFKNKLLYFSVIIIIFLDLMNLIFTSINIVTTFTEILSWIMIFLLILLMDNLNIKDIELENKIIKIGVILSVIVGILVLLKIDSVGTIISIPTTNIMTLILLIALNLAMNYEKKSKSQLIISIAIILLRSRLAIILLLFTYLVKIYQIKNTKKIMIIPIFLIFMIFNMERIVNIINNFELGTILDFKNNYSNLVRVVIWHDVIEYLKNNNNFLGIGAGNFYEVYFKIRSINFEARTAHNLLLNNYIERGIFSVIWILYFYIYITIKCLKSNMSIYIKLSWLYYLVYIQVEAGWEDSRARIIVYLLMFIILVKDKKIVNKRGKR